MLYVTDANGDTATLTTTDVKVSNKLNQPSQLDFSVTDGPLNAAGFAMIQPRVIFTVPANNQQYRITTNSAAGFGLHRKRTIAALNILHDLAEHNVSDKLTGTKTIQDCLNLITKGTKFKYTVHGVFKPKKLSSDFGGTNALDMLTTALTKEFSCEFTNDNYQIDVYQKVGNDNAFVFLAGHELSDIQENTDYSKITTHIKGSSQTEDNTTETKDTTAKKSTKKKVKTTKRKKVTAKKTKTKIKSKSFKGEYTSPMAKVYGVIDAEPVSGNYTTQDSLDKALKKKIHDYPTLSYTATEMMFKRQSPADKLNQVELGNYGFVRDRQDIDVKVRITEMVIYPESHQATEITFGNRKMNFTEQQASLANAQKKLSESFQSRDQIPNVVGRSGYGKAIEVVEK